MAHYSETVSRKTGTKIIVARAEDLDLDPDGGAWVTICDEHSTVCNHATLALARFHAPHVEWCDDCNSDGAS